MNATTDVTTGTNVEAPPGETLLEMRSISKSFGAVAALTDVDFDVAAGQVVALVGDNGAGKSTLAKILSGVYPPDSGTITFAVRGGDDLQSGRRPPARHRHGVPGPRPVREPQRDREPLPRPGAPPAAPRRRGDGDPVVGPVAPTLGAPADRADPRRLVVGWPAPDRRDRPHAARQPQGDHPRRAHGGARRGPDRRGLEPHRAATRPRAWA